MLPTTKDHPCLQERSRPIWHVPTVPSWKESSDEECGNLTSVAGQRTHIPTAPNNQPSSMGMKTKASIKVIPSRQLVELTTGSSGVQRKRPIPTIPGHLWGKHPAPMKRTIPTIPPGGTLLETSPIYQPILAGESMGKTSSVIPKSQEKCAEATSSRMSVEPSTSATTHKGLCDEPQPLAGGPSFNDAPIRPIITGKTASKSATFLPPNSQRDSEEPNPSPTKRTAHKSTKSEDPSRLEPPQESTSDDNAARMQKKEIREILDNASRMSVSAPSTAAAMHDLGSDESQPLTGSNLFQNAPTIHHPILTGESMGEPLTPTLKGRRKSKKSGAPNPTKTAAHVPPQKRTSEEEDDSTTSSIKERFILTTPPEFRFKGDPPRWIRALYLEPLMDGWKREVRTRATVTKRTYDIYYYNPEGQKFRSRVEIGKYLLAEGITKYSAAFNFCFKDVILGDEFEPYEIFSANRKREGVLGTVKKPPPKKPKPPKEKRSCSYLSQLPWSDPETHPELEDMDYSEEGMVFDEEIEVVETGDGQDAIFDPAVLSLRNQPVAMNMPEVKEPHGCVSPPKKQPQPSTSKTEKHSSEPSNKLFCICDDVEHGDMVRCDNAKCEISWFHFRCVNITSAPAGIWYCPVCRGASSDVMNTNIALGK